MKEGLWLDAKISRHSFDKLRSSPAAPDTRRMPRPVLCCSSHRRVLKIFDRLSAIALSLRFAIGGSSGHESTVSHCPMAYRSSDLAKNKVFSLHLFRCECGKAAVRVPIVKQNAALCQTRTQETDLAFIRKQVYLTRPPTNDHSARCRGLGKQMNK